MSQAKSLFPIWLQWVVVAPVSAVMVLGLVPLLLSPDAGAGELALRGVALLVWTSFAGWLTWPDPSVSQELDDEAATLVLRGGDGAFARIPYENFDDCRVVQHVNRSSDSKGRSRETVSYAVTLFKPDAGTFELARHHSSHAAEEEARRCRERMSAAIAARQKSGKGKARRDLKLSRAVTTDQSGDEIRWSWSIAPTLSSWVCLSGFPLAFIALAQSLAMSMFREQKLNSAAHVRATLGYESPTWLLIFEGLLLLYVFAVFVRFVRRIGAGAELRLGRDELVYTQTHPLFAGSPTRVGFEEIDTILADATALRIFRKGEVSAADMQSRHGHGSGGASVGLIRDLYGMLSASIEIEGGRMTTVDRHILDELISARVARSTGRRSREV